MSIRIHELAKKIGMDNKQLLALLKERKYDVKSVSSTIDNISAEAISLEFASQGNAEAAVEPPAQPVPAASASVIAKPEDTTSEGIPTFTTKHPVGPMVRSMQDITREKEEHVQAAKAAKAGKTPTRFGWRIQVTTLPSHGAPVPIDFADSCIVRFTAEALGLIRKGAPATSGSARGPSWRRPLSPTGD